MQKSQPRVRHVLSAIIAVLCLGAGMAVTSCSGRNHGYLVNSLDTGKGEQRQLLKLLRKDRKEPESRFALMNRIAGNLKAEGKNASLILFLTSSVEDHPDDPYNAYWLLMTANTYLEENAPKMAEYYFARVLDNCPDLEVSGQSIHLACLQNLIKITNSPELQIRYYSDLITRFADKVDLGYSYFMLARSYERLGEWQLAIQTYTQFLSYGRYDILIPGIPDAYEYAKRIVDYNTSSKDWTFETLDDLVAAIKTAIDNYDYNALDRYRAKVNFFAMSWKQEPSDNNAQADFDMHDFMGGNHITYSATLDTSSTPNEAYLRTSGWNQYVTVWYLYFRKVNFPADPEIHGRWEWAGIYYGEKL
ncbi:MAG TPA: tetratricopeptide repeat-containing protein [Treponemataceae bacterium]|nr:tetratricopeptide repeat-containing protein [Treponemataceae bacterium]HPS45117.1 tetratricopeptide repeat-containing protein [Treponemataceae bacterium]